MMREGDEKSRDEATGAPLVALHDLLTSSAELEDEAFFLRVATLLRESLATRFALVGRFNAGERSITTLAALNGTKALPSFTYDLAGTPCELVIDRYPCKVATGVQQQFPRDELLVDMGADSYVAQPLLGHCGTPVGLIAVLDDGPHEFGTEAEEFLAVLTGIVAPRVERLIYEEELKRERLETLRAVELKNEMLANVSHELRTPLNGILGAVSLLQPTGLDDEQADLVEVVESSGRMLLSLIDDVLDIAKVESGQFQLSRRELDIASWLADLEAMFTMLAREKSLELSTHLTAGNGTAITDPERLRQVAINLIDNAIKYTSAGRVSATVDVRRTDGGGVLRFQVDDTGPGVPRALRERVFESFTQADGSMTRETGGIGLGLAISRRIVEVLGGKIGVEESHFGGASFWFEVPVGLPASSEETLADKTSSTSDEGERGPLRVLVVEDNRVNQRLAVRMIERLGHEARLANDGAQALNLLDDSSIDVVLMDCQMPVMNGYSATSALRERGDERPVIALTANALDSDRERCFACGMDDFLPKPVTLAVLDECLRRWTPGSLTR